MAQRHLGARTRAGAVCTTLLLVVAGCTIEEPSLPSYETEWLVPLGDYEQTVAEMIEDEPDFVIGADGAISLTTTGEIDGVGVGDQLDVEIDGVSFETSIGTISLDASAPIGFDERLGDLYPQAEVFDGSTLPVPAFPIDVEGDTQDLPGFRSATLASGGIDVSVVNGLPVPIGASFGSNQLRIALIDPDTGLDVLPAPFVVEDEIASGGSYQRTIDLSGTTLPDSVEVQMQGGSPGSVEPVTIIADSRLAVLVSTTPLEVDAAEATFGAQSFADTSTVDVPDSIRVHEAEIEDGQLRFRVRNDLPIEATAAIRIAAFRTPAGDPLTFDLAMPPNTSSTQTQDLADHLLVLDDDGSAQRIDVIADVTSPGSPDVPVTINASDRIAVDVDPISLGFRTVTGVVDAISIDLENSTSELEIPDDLDDLQLQQAELALGFRTSLGMPIAIDLRIEGTNADGVMVPLDAAIDIPAVSGSEPELVNVVLDETNSTIVTFLNNLPETVVFSGAASIGDGVTVGTVAATDSVSARWALIAPMTVALLARTIEGDVEEIDLDEDIRRDIDERLLGMTLEADVTSTLPIEAVAYVGIGRDEASVFTNPDLTIGPITIPAAGPARSETGQREPVLARTTVQIADKDISTITRPFAFQGVRIELPGTDGEFVTLRATDAVRVSGFLRARVLVGEIDR